MREAWQREESFEKESEVITKAKPNDLVEFSNGNKHIEKGMVLRVLVPISTFFTERIVLKERCDELPKGEIVTVKRIVYGSFGSPFLSVVDKWDHVFEFIAPDPEFFEYICG